MVGFSPFFTDLILENPCGLPFLAKLLSAAVAETEVEESRGSFAVKDGDVHFVCHHQTVEYMGVINEPDTEVHDFPSGYLGLDLRKHLQGAEFPVLLITGCLFSMKKKRRPQNSDLYKDIQFETKVPSVSARYWVLFDQKNSNQIGFKVKIGQPEFELPQRASPTGRYQRLRGKLRQFGKSVGWLWFFTRPRGFGTASLLEEELGKLNAAGSTEFNRVCFTYASQGNERFFGFGEQFSHMDFKGKRVPIFVQEQGIGRGDQPVTSAANLVS